MTGVIGHWKAKSFVGLVPQSVRSVLETGTILRDAGHCSLYLPNRESSPDTGVDSLF